MGQVTTTWHSPAPQPASISIFRFRCVLRAGRQCPSVPGRPRPVLVPFPATAARPPCPAAGSLQTGGRVCNHTGAESAQENNPWQECPQSPEWRSPRRQESTTGSGEDWGLLLKIHQHKKRPVIPTAESRAQKQTPARTLPQPRRGAEPPQSSTGAEKAARTQGRGNASPVLGNAQELNPSGWRLKCKTRNHTRRRRRGQSSRKRPPAASNRSPDEPTGRRTATPHNPGRASRAIGQPPQGGERLRLLHLVTG